MREVDTIFTSIPGGPELVAWFGQVPSFHDAEIVSLNLHRRAPSALIIHAWRMTREVDVRCRYILDRHAVVTFVLEDILDLQLGSFSHQNVIGELRLRRTPEHQDRGAFDWLEPSPNNYQIELEPCFGLNGIIRCRRVSVGFAAGKPNDTPE